MRAVTSLSSDCYTRPLRIESVVDGNVADDGRKEKREKKENRWMSGEQAIPRKRSFPIL
jgi:hypothetical protein